MSETFITNIYVEKSRNVHDLNIPLAQDHRQHLILTGKNGSGKSSLLLEINTFLKQIENGDFLIYGNKKPPLYSTLSGTKLTFSTWDVAVISKKYEKGEFIIAYFGAKRQTNLNVPNGIKKVTLKQNYAIEEKANADFIQYIVNLKADRSFAKDDNENETVQKIDEWFERFENRLKILFDVKELELRFDRKNYNFEIITDSNETFSFTTLSDGYSAILSIVTELLLRMENHRTKSYDVEGIVLIDEIETHLHIDLQKIILPFLIDFFPKIQFIVTTHSPFVLSSLANATVCDLETRIVTTDLSSYSYDALIESYFKNDKYSDELKENLAEYERLVLKTDKTMDEKQKQRFLKDYFQHSPKYLSKELLVKLQEIELNELLSTQK